MATEQLNTRIPADVADMLHEMYDKEHPDRADGLRRGQGALLARAIRLLYTVEQAKAQTEARAVRAAAQGRDITVEV